MLVKVIPILSVLSLCVDVIVSEHQPKHAVSTQSYHREDVPLSYKFTAVHIYTTARPENHDPHRKESTKYRTVQYAPLKTTYKDKHRFKLDPESEENFSDPNQRDKNHLEPRKVDLKGYNQNIRSFVPGHNIEVLQSNRENVHNELYRAYHDELVNQKVNIPKFVSGNNPQHIIQNVPDTFRTVEQIPLSEEHNILYSFLPRTNVNKLNNAFVVEKPRITSQALSAKIPRLDLNIARVYGVAHLPQQAPVNKPVHRPVPNPPAYTQALFFPLNSHEKTLLYPVLDPKKNYPIHL